MENTPRWIIDKMIETGTKHLDTQMQVALSADKRAVILGSTYFLAAVGILATLGATTSHITAFACAGCITALVLLTGAMYCLASMLPSDFWGSGLAPNAWQEDVAEDIDIKESLIEHADNIDFKINENDITLNANARLFRTGVLSGAFAPIIGLIVAGFLSII